METEISLIKVYTMLIEMKKDMSMNKIENKKNIDRFVMYTKWILFLIIFSIIENALLHILVVLH